jgi:hypothetical protein
MRKTSYIIECTFTRIQSKENWSLSRPRFVIARRFPDSSWTRGPQRLKPDFFLRLDGTTEVVPFPSLPDQDLLVTKKDEQNPYGARTLLGTRRKYL